MSVVDVHVDDVLNELLQRDYGEGRLIYLHAHFVDLIEFLAYLDELLLHEPLEPATQVLGVDQPAVLLIENFVNILLVNLLLEKHLLQALLYLAVIGTGLGIFLLF